MQTSQCIEVVDGCKILCQFYVFTGLRPEMFLPWNIWNICVCPHWFSLSLLFSMSELEMTRLFLFCKTIKATKLNKHSWLLISDAPLVSLGVGLSLVDFTNTRLLLVTPDPYSRLQVPRLGEHSLGLMQTPLMVIHTLWPRDCKKCCKLLNYDAATATAFFLLLVAIYSGTE